MISGSSLSFAYGEAVVLDAVSITASAGRVVGLIGPNGSGKSTALQLLYGALTPRTGSISLDGDFLRDLTRRQIARKVAVVVQERATELPYTVEEIVALGRLPHLRSFQRLSGSDRDIVREALERVSVGEFADRPFAQLSGGEKQRVLIARALAQQTPYLLLDEPTNHLDVRYQHELLRLVRTLDATIVIVLHDLNLAARYCDDLVLLSEGRVAASGAPHEVLTPTNIEQVYGVVAERIERAGVPQLLFSLADGPAT